MERGGQRMKDRKTAKERSWLEKMLEVVSLLYFIAFMEHKAKFIALYNFICAIQSVGCPFDDMLN
jgi:hypothetical protein